MEAGSRILSKLETLIESKLHHFEQKMNNISQNQISACSKLENYSFKKKGHEQQFTVNAKVMDKLRQADSFMADIGDEDSNSAAQNAREKISEDDGLGEASTFDTAKEYSIFARQDLIKFGFLIAEEKCQWEPTQQSVWVGYFWDTRDGILKVTEDRICRTELFLESLIKSVCKGVVLFPVKKLACLTGQLISMMFVFGSVARLRTRYLYDCVNSRASWCAPVKLSSGAFDELIFWRENLRNLNKSPLQSESGDTTYVCVDASGSGNCNYANVFVDASNLGVGGYIQGSTESDVVGSWLESESNLSSTWRELESVYRVVHSSIPELQGKEVLINTDNKNVCTVLKSGSNKPHLQQIAIKVDKLCTNNNIRLHSRWLPRKYNTDADFLSRCTDSDDWSVVEWVFKVLNDKWGTHTYDRFACHYNAKCKKFNSRYWCPGTSGIDAFEHNWVGENNWLKSGTMHKDRSAEDRRFRQFFHRHSTEDGRFSCKL
ncbi:uncharacterized protein LOC128548167 [Mercenaria mercenaria]|uniref:uncharacterized protein LOC128548167 n=1 Tax=Mercenaria mercenaria TaxID=6596 RepID=UPI00234E7ED2|nr:uncharacterized protein LOC128548167 [Mercenaria mercenaria]